MVSVDLCEMGKNLLTKFERIKPWCAKRNSASTYEKWQEKFCDCIFVQCNLRWLICSAWYCHLTLNWVGFWPSYRLHIHTFIIIPDESSFRLWSASQVNFVNITQLFKSAISHNRLLCACSFQTSLKKCLSFWPTEFLFKNLCHTCIFSKAWHYNWTVAGRVPIANPFYNLLCCQASFKLLLRCLNINTTTSY